jgi:hypothetical protein
MSDNAGLEGCRTGGMQDWRDAGLEGCRTGGISFQSCAN